MDFPTTEPEIIALANRMYSGYMRHIADFPGIDKPALLAKRSSYRLAKKVQIDAMAQAQLATAAKNTSLNFLKEVMINCLRKSEVDVANNPEKLTEIGWGPKQPPQPINLPGQPKNLAATEQGKTCVYLQWDRPQEDCIVRNYIIERRQLEPSGSFGKWTITATSVGEEITLGRQPRGIQLEYRIKAANTAGESISSNVVAVVL